MPNLTTCSKCGCVYEAGSNEQANERHRWCPGCRICVDCQERGIVLGVCLAEHGPLCETCIKAHNERHAETTRRDMSDPKVWRDLARGDLEDR